MNPFRITKEEFNEEKIDFLKSLIILLWKGADGEVNQVEDTLMTNIVTLYYNTYWNPQEVTLSDKEKENIRNTMTKKWEEEEKHPANMQTRILKRQSNTKSTMSKEAARKTILWWKASVSTVSLSLL